MSARGRQVVYQRVKDEILDAIASGRIREGEKLPSERELCRIYSVSRVTVRQALAELTAKGFLESLPGKGTYVRAAGGAARSRTGNLAFLHCPWDEMPGSLSCEGFYGAVMVGIAAAASASGYHCLFQTLRGDRFEAQALSRLVEKVDGIICGELRSPELFDQLRSTGLPLVLVCPSVASRDVDSVEIDNFGGAFQGVSHLVGLGHRRIAFIGGAPSSRPSREREAGYRQALEESGIPVHADHIVSRSWRYEHGYLAMKRLLERARPTAVLAASDVLAMGACQAIHEAGMKVGEDVSVVGFDDVRLAAEGRPPLSTLRVLRREIGENAVRLLIDRIGAGRDYPLRVVVPTILVERESTGRAP